MCGTTTTGHPPEFRVRHIQLKNLMQFYLVFTLTKGATCVMHAQFFYIRSGFSIKGGEGKAPI